MCLVCFIGFTLLYFRMAEIPLVPEIKMADVSKLISHGNLLTRKITGFVRTATSATLILSHAFGADRMTRIVYIYSRLPRTHSLTFWLPETILSLILSILTYRDSTHTHTHTHTLSLSLSLSLSLPETAWPCQLLKHNLMRVIWVRIHSATFSLPVLPLFQPQTQPQKFHQTPNETNNQHERRHVPPRIHFYISVYRYLAWNT